MSGAASNIVATLKSKIKETADELEKYEGVCEETRVRCGTQLCSLLLQCSHVMCISTFTILSSPVVCFHLSKDTNVHTLSLL